MRSVEERAASAAISLILNFFKERRIEVPDFLAHELRDVINQIVGCGMFDDWTNHANHFNKVDECHLCMKPRFN